MIQDKRASETVWAVTYGLCLELEGPERNGDKVTRELPRGNERLNVFMEWLRWLELPHENILETGQHFCNPVTNELLQGGFNYWRKFIG